MSCKPSTIEYVTSDDEEERPKKRPRSKATQKKAAAEKKPRVQKGKGKAVEAAGPETAEAADPPAPKTTGRKRKATVLPKADEVDELASDDKVQIIEWPKVSDLQLICSH